LQGKITIPNEMITETDISLSPHAGGHLGVGGVMANMDSSVGDPSFFLHHGFIDRNWWTWQNIDPTNNLYQISGYTTQKPLPSGGYEEVTLDYVMSSWGVLPDVTVYDVMDAEGGYLCYEYDY
jgi:tyrosinase